MWRGREDGENPKPFPQWVSKLAKLNNPDYNNIYGTPQAELIDEVFMHPFPSPIY